MGYLTCTSHQLYIRMYSMHLELWLYCVMTTFIRIQDTFISRLVLLFTEIFDSIWVVSDEYR